MVAIGLLSWHSLLSRTVYGYRIYAIGSNEQARRGLPALPRCGKRSASRCSCCRASSRPSPACACSAIPAPPLPMSGEQLHAALVSSRFRLWRHVAAGGKGGYTGTMAGAMMLTVLTGILTTINIDESGRQMIFGATLLLLMLFYGRGQAMRA